MFRSFKYLPFITFTLKKIVSCDFDGDEITDMGYYEDNKKNVMNNSNFITKYNVEGAPLLILEITNDGERIIERYFTHF